MTQDAGLEIVIVGGGIAGLATAIALRAPHHRITILERSRFLRETGALISLQPNASKIVDGWHLAEFLAPCRPLADTGFRVADAGGRVVQSLPLDTARFGADRVLYHRQDLHAALRRAAEAPAGGALPGPPVRIRTACEVVACDAARGLVTLAGGETVPADVLVGADGIRSVLRDVVAGEPRPPKPTGMSAYRLLIPTAELAAVEGVPAELIDTTRPVTTMMLSPQAERRVVFGPGRGGELFGFVGLVPDAQVREESGVGADSWVSPGTPAALLEAFHDFPAWLRAVFARCPDDISLWQLRDIDPLPHWVRGRLLLVGDAAHAMLPTQGQGASQAIEDAEALQFFLGRLPRPATPDDVHQALVDVWAARHARAHLIHQFSRAHGPNHKGADAAGKPALNMAEFMEYNCNYNGVEDWLHRMKDGTTGESGQGQEHEVERP